MEAQRSLGQRLGSTTHVSPLRFKLERLRQRYSGVDVADLEDWLIEVANSREARVVLRPEPHTALTMPPPLPELSNEVLVTAICLLQNRDEPQLLRLAAQLISRGPLDFDQLCQLAEQERTEPILGALAIQALRVAPQHALWQQLATKFAPVAPQNEPVLHWTRLAEPVMANGRCNAAAWKLVA